MTNSKSLARLIGALERKHGDPEKVVDKIVRYLKRKNLLYTLPNVLKHLERHADNRTDNYIALTVSEDVSAETENKIRDFIGVKSSVPIEKKINPAIIGGFIAEHNNFVYDGSIDRQLKRLRETLLEN